eukprot:TRINITY_DN1305_c0_g3_i3.p1 TRINITY_DN1305_c0_g3~~TRINITY_DN1305_c0_g3_i3.p1  ORF type:complete len:168 (+),score=22.89 TRINITY_DN1305_c0_g3_i3:165-668(+)
MHNQTVILLYAIALIKQIEEVKPKKKQSKERKKKIQKGVKKMQRQCMELIDEKLLMIDQIDQALAARLESLTKKIQDVQNTLEAKDISQSTLTLPIDHILPSTVRNSKNGFSASFPTFIEFPIHDEKLYCYCQQRSEGEMIECDNTSVCSLILSSVVSSGFILGVWE